MKDSIHTSFSNHKIQSIDWITYTGKAINDNQFRLNIQSYSSGARIMSKMIHKSPCLNHRYYIVIFCYGYRR